MMIKSLTICTKIRTYIYINELYRYFINSLRKLHILVDRMEWIIMIFSIRVGTHSSFQDPAQSPISAAWLLLPL